MSIEKPTLEEIKAKDKLIKAEKRKLVSLLVDLEPERKKAAEGLIDECAFMRATLVQLRKYTDAEGLIDIMQQGSYKIMREHPAMRTYATIITKYTAACKQLFDMLPSKPILPEGDDFDEFRKSK